MGNIDNYIYIRFIFFTFLEQLSIFLITYQRCCWLSIPIWQHCCFNYASSLLNMIFRHEIAITLANEDCQTINIIINDHIALPFNNYENNVWMPTKRVELITLFILYNHLFANNNLFIALWNLYQHMTFFAFVCPIWLKKANQYIRSIMYLWWLPTNLHYELY